jgi:putative selenate reductase
MVFCPENGDPAQVKAKLYLDADRFEAGEGQGFLLTGTDAGVSVTPRPGSESDVPMLFKLLNDRNEGLPIRAEDFGVVP